MTSPAGAEEGPMKLKIPVCCLLLLVVFGSGALCASDPDVDEVEESVTLTGEVGAAGYDDDGAVTAATIDDAEWGLVLVIKDAKGAELLKHLGETVVAEGIIEELYDDSGYSYAIKVVRFSVEDTE